jgi:peptidoglycan biosynthesis protein MviN/MurJ (putative lipid II flippase)
LPPEPPVADDRELGKKIEKAGFAAFVPHLMLRFVGLLGKNVLPNFYGPVVSDVFTEVNDQILNIAFQVGEQCLAPAFLPVFARAYAEHGERRAWKFTSILFTFQIILLLGVVATFIGMPHIYAEWLTQWPGKDPARFDLFNRMLAFASFGLIGMSLASLTSVVLNGYKEFFFAAFGDFMLKLCIVGGIFTGLILKNPDWRFVAGGAVVGGTLNLVTHLLALGPSRLKRFALSLDWGDPYLRAFIALVLPLLGGILISKWRDLVVNNVLTSSPLLPTYYGQGRSITESIQYLIPYTLSIALLPFFCDLSARHDNERLGRVLTTVIRLLVWFFVPVAIAFAAASTHVSTAFFAGKLLHAAEVANPALVSRIYAIQMPFVAIELMVLQALFSNKRVIAPTLAGAVFSVLTAGVCWYGVKLEYVTTPAGILALVSVAALVARVLKSLLLVGLLRSSVPVLPVKESLLFSGKLLVAGGASAVVAYLVAHAKHGNGFVLNIAMASAVGVASLTVFVALSLALRMDEPRQFWHWTLEKLKRKRAPKS